MRFRHRQGRVFGLGRSKAHELARAGEFPCPVLRIGRSCRITRSHLFSALGIPAGEEDSRPPAGKPEPEGDLMAAGQLADLRMADREIPVTVVIRAVASHTWSRYWAGVVRYLVSLRHAARSAVRSTVPILCVLDPCWPMAVRHTIYLRKLPTRRRPPRSTRAPARSSAWSWPASS